MNLDQAIERLQALCRQGDASALHQEMFATDAAVGGEGAPGITVGADLLPVLTGMLDITPQLTIRSVRTTPLSDDTAVTWLEWTSPKAGGQPRETMALRSLTVWKKQGAGWAIAADMYGMGSFSAA
jgi:ketosteroid isomerase-like protein